MKFQSIDTVESISKEDFIQNYLKKRKPLLLKGYAKNWKDFDKWNLDYIKDKAGEQIVPLYDSKPADPKKSSDTPATYMKFNEYVDLIKKEPSDLRIFFFIIKDKIPELLKNFTFPDLGLKYFERLPTLFFGGSEAKVLMHYDVDMTDFFTFSFMEINEFCYLIQNNQKRFTKFLFQSIQFMRLTMITLITKNFRH